MFFFNTSVQEEEEERDNQDTPEVAGSSTESPAEAGDNTDTTRVAGGSTESPTEAGSSTDAPEVAGSSPLPLPVAGVTSIQDREEEEESFITARSPGGSRGFLGPGGSLTDSLQLYRGETPARRREVPGPLRGSRSAPTSGSPPSFVREEVERLERSSSEGGGGRLLVGTVERVEVRVQLEAVTPGLASSSTSSGTSSGTSSDTSGRPPVLPPAARNPSTAVEVAQREEEERVHSIPLNNPDQQAGGGGAGEDAPDEAPGLWIGVQQAGALMLQSGLALGAAALGLLESLGMYSSMELIFKLIVCLFVLVNYSQAHPGRMALLVLV